MIVAPADRPAAAGAIRKGRGRRLVALAVPLDAAVAVVARRARERGEDSVVPLRWTYGQSLYRDDSATLEDLREAVTTLGEIECTTRRVLGGAHPLTTWIEEDLRDARAALRARETPPTSK